MIFDISKRGGRGAFPLFLFLVILMATPLWANGGSDEGYDAAAALEEAEALIADGRDDEAIEALTRIARTDPEQMERVQKLVREILSRKNRLDELFQEAIAAIDADNSEEANRVVTRIRDEFPYLNRDDRNRLIIIITANSRQEDLKIMRAVFEAANGRWNQDRLLDALEIYLTGMRDGGFEGRPYNDMVTYREYKDVVAPVRGPTPYPDDPVREEMIWDIYGTDVPEADILTNRIHDSIAAWIADAAGLDSLVQSAAAGIGTSDPQLWETLSEQLTAALRALDAGSDTLRTQGDDLEDRWNTIFEKFQKAPEVFHFERQVFFLFGWNGSEFEDEGVFFLQELIREDAFLVVADAMAASMLSDLDAGRDAFRSEAWNAAAPSLIRSAASTEALNGYLDRADDYVTARAAAGNTRLKERIDARRTAGAYSAAAAPYWQALAALGIQSESLAAVDLGTGENAFEELAAAVQELVVRAEDLEAAWVEEFAALSLLPDSGADVPVRIDADLREDLAAAISTYKEDRINIYVRAIEDLFEIQQGLVEEAVNVDPDALRLYALGAQTDEGIAPERHPSDALSGGIEPALERLENAGRSLEGFLEVTTSMLEAQPPIENPQEVIRYQELAEDLQVTVDTLTNELTQLDREARVFANAALGAETSAINALERARRDLATARAAVRRGTQTANIDEYYRAKDLYNVVDESLDRADNFYLEMFNNDRDIAENSGLDEERKALRGQVEGERGDIAIIVKDDAIDRAEALYDQASYYDGLDVVTVAQEFWKDSYNGQEDPVLAFWIDLFTNALLALRDTTINPNDPLFSEMNQYLNLANRYYEAGVRIRTEDPGNADAPLSFKAASDLLSQVLGVFPGNEAARLLELKILAETSPETFANQARDIINQARRAIVAGNLEALRGSETEQGLYARMIVLEQVRPDFPNLQETIIDAEELLFPAPEEQFSQAQINESLSFYQRALTIYDNLGSEGALQALDILDDALRIWPFNTAAQDLERRIRRGPVPGQERIPTSPELEARLKAINDAIARQDYALAIILTDAIPTLFPSEQNHPDVLEVRIKLEPFR